MSFFDLFKPKWKHQDKDIRLSAVQKGNLKVSVLIGIIKNKEEEKHIRQAAISAVKDAAALGELLFSKEGWSLRHDLANAIEDTATIEQLLHQATESREKKIIALLKSRMEAVRMNGQSSLSDEELIEIAGRNESHAITRDAIVKIKDPKKLGDWLSQKAENQELDYSHYDGFGKAVKKFKLENIGSYINSMKLIDHLYSTMTKKKDLTQLIQIIIDKGKCKDYLENYLISQRDHCMALLYSIPKLEDVLELTQTAKYDEAKLCAYIVGQEEVMGNESYQQALIAMLTAKKRKLTPDMTKLVKKMGKDIVYNNVEIKREIRCEECKGTGKILDDTSMIPCDECAGTGGRIVIEEKLESVEIV